MTAGIELTGGGVTGADQGSRSEASLTGAGAGGGSTGCVGGCETGTFPVFIASTSCAIVRTSGFHASAGASEAGISVGRTAAGGAVGGIDDIEGDGGTNEGTGMSGFGTAGRD